jgi:hypothetical protein
MKLFDDLCFICLENTDVEQHHTSYKDDETIPLCGSCHSKVHVKDGFHDHLEPELSRKEASRNGHIDGRNGATYSVYVNDHELTHWIDHQIENNRGIHNQAHLFVLGLKRLKNNPEENPTEIV